MTTRRLCLLLAAGLAGRVAGCASVTPATPAADSHGIVAGTVAYRERIALAPDAIVEVWMIDASPGLMIQAIVAQATIATAGQQVPIRFELRYQRDRILPDHRYVVKAVIQSQGQTLFADDVGRPVITLGEPSEVALVLQGVAGAQEGPPRR